MIETIDDSPIDPLQKRLLYIDNNDSVKSELGYQYMSPDHIFIKSLMTRKDSMYKGYATQLITTLKKRANTITVIAATSGLRDFYEDRGFMGSGRYLTWVKH